MSLERGEERGRGRPDLPDGVEGGGECKDEDAKEGIESTGILATPWVGEVARPVATADS